MNQYVVTMKHDRGIIRIAVSASSADAAATKVCSFELAPRSAVLSVVES